jgi:hypothetical protein
MNILKYIIFLLVATIFVTACNNSEADSGKLPADLVHNPKSASGKTNTTGNPKLVFEKDTHDFGKVIEGEIITYAFKFVNEGDADLLISNVKASCGCTVPEFTKDAIAPGTKGTIKVKFDSNNRKGFQNKTITVISNTHPNTKVLRIKAQVIVPERY